MTKFALALMTIAACSAQDLNQQVAELRDLVLKLQARIDVLEKRSRPVVETKEAVVSSAAPVVPASPGPLENTTINVAFDGYYGFNFNSPIGRTNLLRAYDVSSNSFSLNQADIVIENAADPANGKHFGARLDLQFGQATQTLQGNPVNEPRPDIYRNIFQAYGTWAPNSRLTLDFGKWSSSIGLEGNYTKDQINYSRSYLFDFLPFYHMGVRAAYKLNDALTVNYWLDNGTQQTEAFNNYKDELVGFVATPRKNLSWTVNYYLGQEHPDVIYYPYTSPPGLPTIQGESFQPIIPAPKGKTHIFDSYATWQPTQRWTLAFEGDDVDREERDELGAGAYRRWSVLCPLPVDSERRAGRADRIHFRSRRVIYGRHSSLEGDNPHHRVQSVRRIPGAPRMAARFFQSALFPHRHAGIIE